MKTLFDIRSGKEIGNEHTLLLEAGSHFYTYAYWHKATKTIDGLQYVSYTEADELDAVTDLSERLGKTSVQAAVICSAFTQSLLVPTKFFSEDDSLLETVYGRGAQVQLYDTVAEWQMTNVYSLPRRLYEATQGLFPSVQYFHAYTPAIKIYNGYIADNQLLVHFTAQAFRVLVKKDSAIQLAQTYAYKTPLDVVYFLLKICAELGLSQQTVYVILSGLVEKASQLFVEIEQYFSNVHFAHPPEISLPGNDHPQHFFTSLYNLASCAS